ncbi:BspA family leucine-rich repeat surface protein [Enterococcus sp. DIV1420a]|uniref:BspA family leucine-rich repeat surface protein n=1 Tax=Enterococcus sp. DIV1420a TaxID=2774672 RepID=UPI003F28540E
MKAMFQGTSLLPSVPVETWTVGKVTDTSYMFWSSGITQADLRPWYINQITTMQSMFSRSKVSEVRFGQAGSIPWQVANMNSMFWGTLNLKYVDINLWRIDNLASATNMFEGSAIEKIDLSTWHPTQTGINMSYMFNNMPKLGQADMRGFTNLDSQITTNILGTGQAANPLMLIVQNVPGNNAFLTRDLVKESGRKFVEFPKLISNGGKFNDNSRQKSYFEKISVTPEQLDIQQVEKFLSANTPTRGAHNFTGWVRSLLEGSTVNSLFDLISNRVTYTAQWAEKDVSTSTDNKKEPHQASLEIAYVPKDFSLPYTTLGAQGEVAIPVAKKDSFNLGVRDTNGRNTPWTVSAQLTWVGQEVPGGYIQSVNTAGTVKLNESDGTYNTATDLKATSGEVAGTQSVKITTSKDIVMQTKQEGDRDGVYDYDLGNAQLTVPDLSKVPQGKYTGIVEWNLETAE